MSKGLLSGGFSAGYLPFEDQNLLPRIHDHSISLGHWNIKRQVLSQNGSCNQPWCSASYPPVKTQSICSYVVTLHVAAELTCAPAGGPHHFPPSLPAAPSIKSPSKGENGGGVRSGGLILKLLTSEFTTPKDMLNGDPPPQEGTQQPLILDKLHWKLELWCWTQPTVVHAPSDSKDWSRTQWAANSKLLAQLKFWMVREGKWQALVLCNRKGHPFEWAHNTDIAIATDICGVVVVQL